jgi:hypothetical protein
MAALNGHGLRLSLPPGWDGHVYRRPVLAPDVGRAIVHAGNFPLPPERGDFGSGAVEVMGARHTLLVLFEQNPASAGSALYNTPYSPLRPGDFSPNGLQKMIDGQAGAQRFFRVGRRAFTLYAVAGSYANRAAAAQSVNAALATLGVDA